MKYIILTIALVSLNICAQTTTIINQATIGGDNMDYSKSSILNSDGTIIVVGQTVSGISADKTTASFGGQDVWLLKLNSDFSIAWQYSFGGSGTEQEPEIIQTSDGGYLLGCASDSPISGNKTIAAVGSRDYWIVKIDAFGSIEWQTGFGGTASDNFVGLVETSTGDFIAAGTSNSPISGSKSENSYGLADYWIVKFDLTGAQIWDKTVGGSDYDQATDISIDSFDNVVISGYSFSSTSGLKSENSFGDEDYWFVKIDQAANLIWDKTIGANTTDAYCYHYTKGTSTYFAGYSFSNASGLKSEDNFGGADFWVGKLDQNGNLIWEKTIGGTNDDGPIGITVTSDFQLLLGGASNSDVSGDKSENSIGGSQDFWIVSLDTNSNFIWDKTIGGSQIEGMDEIIEKSNNNYICFGYSASNISGDKDDVSRGLEDYWIVELASNVGLIKNDNNSISIFPNPTLNILNFSSPVSNVKIVNMQGQLMHQELTNQVTKIEFGNLSSGLYFIQYDFEGMTRSQKITVN